MGRILRTSILLGAICLVPAAYGVIGTMDVVPAATLLLPYFEVDLGTSASVDTDFAVRNVSTSPIIAHVVVYTDLGVPTLFFDIFLTGNDVERVHIRDIFEGNVVALGEDTSITDQAPPETETSLFDNGFESGDLSGWTRFESRATAQTMRAYHTGGVSGRSGLAAGVDHGDELARGYITVDSAIDFGSGFPDETGYFISGGTGIASNNNFLWGEYFVQDNANNASFGNTLVHIEADDSDPRVTTPGQYTFYARFVGGTAADNREPLATSWTAPFADVTGASNTTLSYWRDPKVVVEPFPQGMLPAWVPLSQAFLGVHDQLGNLEIIDSTAVKAFPNACGRTSVDSIEVGYFAINLNAVDTGLFDMVSQGVIVSNEHTPGRMGTSKYGVTFDNASTFFPIMKSGEGVQE